MRETLEAAERLGYTVRRLENDLRAQRRRQAALPRQPELRRKIIVDSGDDFHIITKLIIIRFPPQQIAAFLQPRGYYPPIQTNRKQLSTIHMSKSPSTDSHVDNAAFKPLLSTPHTGNDRQRRLWRLLEEMLVDNDYWVGSIAAALTLPSPSESRSSGWCSGGIAARGRCGCGRRPGCRKGRIHGRRWR